MENILALYIRLSLDDGDLDENKIWSNSVQNQIAYLRNYLMINSEVKTGEVRQFIDDGHTGTNLERPALQEMLDLVRQGKVKCIVVKDLSRFGRNYFEVGKYLEQIFPCLGVRFIAVDDGYDSKNDNGNVPGVDIVFKNIIYDYYSKELSGKVLQTKRNLAKKGLFLGGIPPFGYIRNPNNRHQLIIDYKSAKSVRRIFCLALEGKNQAEIARILNREQVENPRQRLWRLNIRRGDMTEEQINATKWTADAVRNILRNPAVIGSVTNHRVERKALGREELRLVNKSDHIIVPNMHEAIIEKEIFETIQKEYMKQNNRLGQTKRIGRSYPLSGILKCAYCGHNLVAEGKHNKYYVCKYARTSVEKEHPKIKMDEKALLDALLSMIPIMLRLQMESPIKINANQATPQIMDTVMPQNGYYNRKRKLSELYEEYASGKIERAVFLDCKRTLKEECGEDIKKGIAPKLELPQMSIEKVLEDKTGEWLTKDLLKSIIEEIQVFGDLKIRIVWKCRDWFIGK
ncbi:MAG: recombinase family protein [Lachnospiraceae bacterium]